MTREGDQLLKPRIIASVIVLFYPWKGVCLSMDRLWILVWLNHESGVAHESPAEQDIEEFWMSLRQFGFGILQGFAHWHAGDRQAWIEQYAEHFLGFRVCERGSAHESGSALVAGEEQALDKVIVDRVNIVSVPAAPLDSHEGAPGIGQSGGILGGK